MDKEEDKKVGQPTEEDATKDEIVFEDDDEGEDLAERIKRLKKKLKEATAEKSEYLAGWQRERADYANYRKDQDKYRQEIVKFAKEDLLLELIQLADSFEMAFSNKEAWNTAPENWRKGVEYIYSQLQSIFKFNGLEEINPLNQPFDPNNQFSVGVMETDDSAKDNLVLEVLKKGYAMGNKTIRPAQVKVAQIKK